MAGMIIVRGGHARPCVNAPDRVTAALHSPPWPALPRGWGCQVIAAG